MSFTVSAQQSQQQKSQTEGQQKKDPKDKKAEEPQDEDEQGVRLGTQLVTVPFNVTDKTNRYINDLTKDDLEILEDNKPQGVFSFERQTDLPITIAMLIDISGSQEYTLPYEKAAGQRFLQKVLRPQKDLAAIVSFEGDVELVQSLTQDMKKLSQALDSVRVPVTGAAVGGIGGTPPINGGSRVGGTSLYDAVYAVSADLLSREAGRRVIILLTDGQDTTSKVKMREAIERTWRNEVIVYPIGIGDRSYGIDSGTLKKIASETGGRAFFPRDEQDLDKAFRMIDEDLRSQYIVSYEPSNEAKDGSFRTIQMKVKNRKELTVRHRRGYFAPKES
jgi:VWFA-related protein